MPRRCAARAPMVACQPSGFRARSPLLGAPLIQLHDLRNRPGTECKRRQPHGSREVVPWHPLPVHYFVWIRSQMRLRMRQPSLEYRADLVFHDAAGIGGRIAEVGKYAPQVTDFQPQLEPQPAPHGVGHDLVWGRMTAAGVGPYSRPGPLSQRPPGEQDASDVVEDVDREGEMHRRLGPVDLRLKALADRLAGGVDKNNEFFGGYPHGGQLALLAVGTREL